MDEIVELAVGAFHLIAKDLSSRSKMRQLNCIPIFVQVILFILCLSLFKVLCCCYSCCTQT